MAISITIRDVPNETRDALAARAAASGRSLQEYLSAELNQLAARPDINTALAVVRERARGYPPIDRQRILDELDADRS